jgi:hypothetical protein
MALLALLQESGFQDLQWLPRQQRLALHQLKMLSYEL